MERIRSLIAVAIGFMLAPAAWADAPPPRNLQLRHLAELIRAAGHFCPEAVSTVPYTGRDADSLEQRGLRPERVTCSNGRVYMVAYVRRWRGRSGEPPKPVVRPLRV